MASVYCLLALFILILHVLGTVSVVVVPLVIPVGALVWWLPVLPCIIIMWATMKGCPLSQLETELVYLGGCGKERKETHEQYTSVELEEIARRYSGVQINGKLASCCLMVAFLYTWAVFVYRSRKQLPRFSLDLPRISFREGAY